MTKKKNRDDREVERLTKNILIKLDSEYFFSKGGKYSKKSFKMTIS